MPSNHKTKPATQSPSFQILQSALQLAALIKGDPSGIEEDFLKKGEQLVGVYSDDNYTPKRFPNLNTEKSEIIKRAIEDISIGVMILRSSTLGLVSHNNEIQPYITPHGTTPKGNVIFSINWKNIAAFRNWRAGESDPISQDDINAAIYKLAEVLSKSI